MVKLSICRERRYIRYHIPMFVFESEAFEDVIWVDIEPSLEKIWLCDN